MSNVAKLLRELIALPSVNPAFLPVNDPLAGEQRIADFLASVAAGAGLDVDLQKVEAGRANVLARLAPGGRQRQRVLLVPHLDTVGAEPDQFVPRIRGDRVFGRGACDTKGSIAAMMDALKSLAHSRHRPRHTEILFAGVVDEENAQAGSRALISRGVKGDLAIVGEPTRLEVVTAHKGSVWLSLETRGKSAHGALPHLGRNAIHAMAHVVDALETDYVVSLRRRRHRLLGSPTLNVGTIRGGVQPNIVPERCAITIDRRTLPGESEAGVRREMGAFLRRRHLKVSFGSEKLAPCPPMETDARRPLVREFLRAAGRRHPAGVHFFCDAAVLSEGGIPSIVFGPGDIAHAHSAREWISLKSLARARDVLLRFLTSLP